MAAYSRPRELPVPLFEPVAIIGMAMRLPGRVRNSVDFWDLLTQKKNGLCQVPRDRFNINGFYDASGLPGTIPMDKGYFLEDVEIQQFDPTVFPIPKKELERLDPSQRQMLQVAYECMENAGVSSWRGSNVGCYIGCFSEDWQDLNAKETEHSGGYRATGYGDFALSNRVSYEFDLHGPSMTVKTACSSSLVCLDLACEAIKNRQCDAALVGGINLIFSPTMWIALHDQGLLSPTGQCHTFDASADGYARGEAVNMILIKRLNDALRDNDPIRAVIRGTNVNADGRTAGMLIPSSIAQAALIRYTYEVAGIEDLSETAIVETHGTGTPVGDPLEVEAVAKCFGTKGVIITSTKPSVGHSEGAAGLTSVIKCVLALEKSTIPPNINFKTTNPKIPFEKYNLHVPTQVEPWPRGRAERASVNGFGIGGVNAHVILESSRQFGISQRQLLSGDSGNKTMHNLLLFSAYSLESLQAQLDSYQDYINSNKISMCDLAYSLANRREHKPYRTYAVASGASHLQRQAPQMIQTPSPRIAWVFTGQGAQWPRMGAELIDTNATFRDSIRRLDEFISKIPEPPTWSIEDELRKDNQSSRVYEAEMGHPLTLAVQIGLIDILRSWGLTPDLVLGHSAGEIAGSYACGALTAELAMAISVSRSISNHSHPRRGSMAAVGIGRDDILPYLVPGVVIACENSQCSVTLSGDTEGVSKVIAALNTDRPDVFTRFLRVEKAFHSHHMLDYGPSYEEHLQRHLPPDQSAKPKIPFYSSVTGKRIAPDDNLGSAYWRKNMESPVLFNSALRSAMGDETKRMIILEIGPHPALGGPIRQIIGDMERLDVHIGTISRDRGCQESMLQLVGKLFQNNVPMDYSTICPPGQFIKDLPSYCWKQETRFWVESRISNEWRFREYPPHELLGSRVIENASEFCWRAMLNLEDVNWLSGHEIHGKVVLPGAAYIAMIGEAIRQLNRTSTYSLRNVQMTSARVFTDGETVELLTNLTPISIDGSENSPWYTFTISSLTGRRWIKNCSGEARPSTDESVSLKHMFTPDHRFPRKVDDNSWYGSLSRIGFNLTGLFRGMKSISAATTTHEAVATLPVRDTSHGNGRSYSLHPSIIDKCFHALIIAAYRGLGRNMNTLSIPTFIEEMVVSHSTTDLNVIASVDVLDRGSLTGNLIAQSAGRQVVYLRGFKTSAVEANVEMNKEPIISQFEWKPSGDFGELKNYMHPRQEIPKVWPLLEELIILCILDHQKHINLGDMTPQYLASFVEWMESYMDNYTSGGNKFVSKVLHLENMSTKQRLARIEEIVAGMSTSSWSMFSTAIYRLFKAAPAIFNGEIHPLGVLLEDDVLTRVYDAGETLDFSGALHLIANTNPRLRVLEVGAGTGGTTAKVLQALKTSYGESLYSRYIYTDISPGFLAAARERFADFENIEYAVLDITKDPIEQGFQPASYDLVICSNVLHATPSLQTSLRYGRSLLSEGGRLFLEEICPDAKFVNYIYGFLPGWWLGAGDKRKKQPYISPERWEEELISAGFPKPEAFSLDGISPFHTSGAYIVARENMVTKPSRVTLMCYSTGEEQPYIAQMRRCLESQHVAVDVCHFGQDIPLHQDVISFLDLQEPTLHSLSKDTFETLMGYLKTQKAKILWMMPSSQVGCVDPRASMMLGLARTARNELHINLFTVEVDRATPPSATAEAVAKILFRVKSPDMDLARMNPDYEYAIVGGEILIPRLHWQTVPKAVMDHRKQEEPDSLTARRIHIETLGLLHTMAWSEATIPTLGDGDVIVETRAIGLNFRDLLISLGVLDNSTSELGLEGSGIVRAVGSSIQHVSVGDHVLYLGKGCFATHLKIPGILCLKMDDSMSFEQGAAVPCVYSTALLALVDKANLRRGQSILIQSACSGVGLAAIQIGQMLDANIYCTVGNETKAQYLVDNYGIDRSHIFNSRDLSFLASVMKATNNRGVDVVLNSLSGDLLHASWKCVAEFGVMVEIGKRDFRRRAKLSMEAFEQNRTFIGLDLLHFIQIQPDQAAKLLRRCMTYIRSGAIKGPTIASTFPAALIQDAFRTMQTAAHIGKIVITMPEDLDELNCTPPIPTSVFRQDRTYLLVGGLGGLGRATSNWMIENGARHLTFLSRSSREGPETSDFLEELRSQNCQVQLVAGSVNNMSDVQLAVQSATRPIAGVINMAMALKDVGLTEMTFSDWTTAIEPKVQGTWNLHNAITSDLDFFLLFSSFSGIVGQPGQANYAAANAFLDAFVQYRHRNGLVASVIDVGVMDEVGFVSQNIKIRDRFERSGMHLLREQHLLDAIAVALARSKPSSIRSQNGEGVYDNPSQVLLGFITSTPISSPSNRVAWKRDSRMAIYHNLDKSTEVATTNAPKKSLKSLLESESSEKGKTQIIAKAIAGALANFLIKEEEDVPLDTPLNELGIDSLISVEIRNWIRQQSGVDVNIFTIVQSSSMLSLGDYVRKAMSGSTVV
ncbi:putative polyketide synthase [Hypoxylon sp. NC0597]|nr:putative polyketide synthase [Hypoxylon sp. NC0597]